MTHTNESNDPDLLETKTKGNEVKDLKCKTERHDHENVLKSPQVDKDQNIKKLLEKRKKSYHSLRNPNRCYWISSWYFYISNSSWSKHRCSYSRMYIVLI